MRARPLLVALAVTTAVPQFANAESCTKAARSLIGRPSSWASAEPFHLRIANKRYDLSLSFDSEITHADIFRDILKDSKLLGELEQALEATPLQESQKLVWSEDELAKLFEMSAAQMKAFCLRKNLASKKGPFKMTDLNPVYFDALMTSFTQALDHIHPETVFDIGRQAKTPKDLQKFFDRYLEIVNVIFEKEKYPVWASQDLNFIEIKHNSYELIPEKFDALVRKQLHTRFPRASTHLHLALPEALPEPKILAIARAIEARIVLRMIRESGDRGAKLAYSEFSTLTRKLKIPDDSLSTANRGVVKLIKKAFKKPYVAYDFEIRQWYSISEGLGDLQFAAKLASEHERLLRVSENALPSSRARVEDLSTNNLQGALAYAAEVLKNSLKPEEQKLARNLADWSAQITAANNITPELRRKISEALQDFEIEELLSENNLLKP